MSRVYSIPYTGTLTNSGGNADLLEVLPADDKPVRLLGFILGQSTEVADAAEESLGITVSRMSATITTGNGTSVTPVPVDSAHSAFGGTAECNGATVATTSGSNTSFAELAWNIRNSPYEVWFPPEVAPKAKQGEGLFVRCNSTPADDITISMTFFVEEL